MAEQQHPLSLEELRIVSHPVRLRLLDALSHVRQATATSMAAMIGESTGSTSYHLRKLAEHGFVVEDTTRSNAKERWWRLARRNVVVGADTSDPQAPAALALTEVFLRERAQLVDARFASFVAQTMHEGPGEWAEAMGQSEAVLLLNAQELRELSKELDAVVRTYAQASRRREEAGTLEVGVVPVDVSVRAFPVLDVDPYPPGEQASDEDGE